MRAYVYYSVSMFRRLWLLVALGFVLYLPALPNHFVWDDEEQVVANTAVHTIANIPELFSGSTFNSGGSAKLGGLYYKPLMSISFAIIYSIFGPSPWAFHLFQVGLHIGVVLLLYLIFCRIWKNKWLAFFVSTLFLIHPQNVETVAYISSLQDTLYMFFGMLGLTWLIGRDKDINWHDLIFAGACLFLALLGKETGGLFGLIIGLYLFLYKKKLDVWHWAGVVTCVFVVYLYLRVGVAQVGLEKNMFTSMATLPLLTRLGNIPAIVWHYLSQWIWPQYLSISQHWANRQPGILEWIELLGLVFGWLGILWWGLKRKDTNLVFFWVWFGLAIAFHVQIFPLDLTVADRWFYLPMVGLIGSMGSMGSMGYRVCSIKYGNIIIAIILFALFVRSSIRIQNWRDGLTLYKHDSQIMPNSFDLQNNLGVELYRSGDMKGAKEHFIRSTEISPTWWTNWNNLGVIIEAEGDLDTALIYYRRSIDNGQYYLAYGNYARVLLKQKKWLEARTFIENSLILYPSNQVLLETYQYLRINERQLQ